MQNETQTRRTPPSQRRARLRLAILVAVVIVLFASIGVVIAATRGNNSEPTAQVPPTASPSATPGPDTTLVSYDSLMRARIRDLRGIIDRSGANRWCLYPAVETVRPGGKLGAGEWPNDPWSRQPLSPGTERGAYQYLPAADRRSYRLVGYLDAGKTYVVSGGMSGRMMVAYNHRGEEGIHLIQQYLDTYIREQGSCPDPHDVRHKGAVGRYGKVYWPSNPWDHHDMEQRSDRGSFAYEVAADHRSYTLILHRARKADYVLHGAAVN